MEAVASRHTCVRRYIERRSAWSDLLCLIFVPISLPASSTECLGRACIAPSEEGRLRTRGSRTERKRERKTEREGRQQFQYTVRQRRKGNRKRNTNS